VTTLGMFGGISRDALGYLQASAATPGTFYRANLPRVGLYDSAGDTGSAALADGVMTAVRLPLAAGDVVTNLTFVSGTATSGTEANWWFALYDTSATPALIAQTADQTTGDFAASTAKTLALSSAYTVTRTGIYWAAIMVHCSAGTPVSLIGALGVKPVATGEGNLAVRSGSSLTTAATATLASPTYTPFVPYCVAT
jgi:hypothetical protein